MFRQIARGKAILGMDQPDSIAGIVEMKEMQDGVTRDQEYRGQAGEEETGESRDACDCRRDALDGWTQSRSKVAVDQNGSREKSTLNLDRSAAKSGTDKTRLILLLRVASCEGL
jgi:hypothetical protein